METEETRDGQQPSDQQGDESVEEFKQEIEEDPSRAPAPTEDLERQRGG